MERILLKQPWNIESTTLNYHMSVMPNKNKDLPWLEANLKKKKKNFGIYKGFLKYKFYKTLLTFKTITIGVFTCQNGGC